MIDTVCIGLIGCGTVGGGVYEILKKQQDQFLRRYGKKYFIKTICVKHVDKKRDVEIDSTTKIVDDYMIILDDPTISIVIELIGGTTDAWTIMQECFKRGKHLITYPEAERTETSFIELETKPYYPSYPSVHLGFEATVGGGTPILHTLQTYYNSDDIQVVKGIMNGSTNFILSKLLLEGRSYKQVYDEAMRLGYLEGDPNYDIEGKDARSKLMILNRLAFGVVSEEDNVVCIGIDAITSDEMKYWNNRGYVIKLLGYSSKQEDGSIASCVIPTLVPQSNPLAGIHYANNVIQISSRDMEDVSVIGSGAGRYPTANSVLTDLLYISNHEFVNTAVWPEQQERRVHSSVRGTFLFRVGVELKTLEDTTLTEALAQRDALMNGSTAKSVFMMRLYSV